VVTAIGLSADRNRVLATVRLTKAAGDLAVQDSRFWIVRPRADARGVSGFGALLSGAYIGADAGHVRETRNTFIGLEVPPVVTAARQGASYVLRSGSLGSIHDGAPVYYRHVEVGRVTGTALNADGKGVTIDVFVDAPYHRYIGLNTRWWDASGANLSLDSRGGNFSMQSLEALLLGGVAFRPSPGQPAGAPAPAGTVFDLASDGIDAPDQPDGTPAVVEMRFAQSLRGLSVGAAVDFRGVPLGEVTQVNLERNPRAGAVDMRVTLNLYPDRLGPQFRASAEHADGTAGKALLRKLVADGLRGQLRTGNLLTNQRYVALDLFPNAPQARVDLSRTPVELPTVPNALDDLQAEVADFAKKLDGVPYAKIDADLQRTFARVHRLFQQAETQLAPQAQESLATARQAVDAAGEAMQTPLLLQRDARQAREQLARALTALDALANLVEQRPASLVWGSAAAF